MTGRKLSHYALAEKVGEGGVGVVYKAFDSRLDRVVAVKLLLPDKLGDQERKRRFLLEARAASALNHPNIVTIFDVGSEDGADFIVMEFVDGITLDRTLATRRLRVPEALDYAIQISDALACAHAAGIVHRDLKPGNVIINKDGLVKVLDFGLAKLIDKGPRSPAGSTITLSPCTENNSILGTTAYMSPEQAQGKTVDSRCDVFSFGSLLYEMVSGRRPFEEDSWLGTLTSILHKEPPPLTDIPPDLARVIARCLRKETGWRFQHMDDVKVELAELRRETESPKHTPPRTQADVSPRPRGMLLLVFGLALTVLAAAGLAMHFLSKQPPSIALPALTRVTSDAGLSTDPALSPDGKLVAYASDRATGGNLDIWVQDTIGGNAARLTADPADDREPAFSPDGTRIAFRSERLGGGIYVVPALGGEARLLAPGGREPRFSPDGKWIAYWTGQDLNFGSRLFVIPAAGGLPRQLQPQFSVLKSVVWAPDGRHLLFYADYKSQWDWYLTPLEGGEVVATGALPMLDKYHLERNYLGGARLLPTDWNSHGDVIFSARTGDSTGVWRVPLSLANGHLAGAPERITLGSGEDVSSTLSATGRLAFSSQILTSHLWMLPADTNAAKVTGPMRELTNYTMNEVYSHSDDGGHKVVWATSHASEVDLWVKDLVTDKVSFLASAAGEQGAPKLSRDGREVVYQVVEDGKAALYTISTHSGVPKRVCAACGRPSHWTTDGKFILFDWDTIETGHVAGPRIPVFGASVLEVASGRTFPVLRHNTPLYSPRFSPDDRWVAFHLQNGPATRTIYAAPFRVGTLSPETEWIAVTDGKSADREPYWSPDGKLIYYLSERDGFRCIWAQRVDPVTRKPAGEPFAVYHFHNARRSLANTGYGTGLVGLSIAAGKILFAQGEATGNIWMTDWLIRR